MSKQKLNTTVRLYSDGSYKVNGVKSIHLEGHIHYNKCYRPGCALFLNGDLIFRGSISNENIYNFQNNILPNIPKAEEQTVPFV